MKKKPSEIFDTSLRKTIEAVTPSLNDHFGVKYEKEPWEKEFDEGWARNNPEHPRIAKREAVRRFIKSLLDAERAELVKQLDWRNRTDGTKFNDGSDVVDWYDTVIEKIKTNGL